MLSNVSNFLVNASKYQGTAIPTVFGDGLAGKAVTGLIRIPAFLASLAAVQMAGELAIRGLSSTLSTIGIKATEDNWITKTSNWIENRGVRPYGKTKTAYSVDNEKEVKYQYPTKELAIKMIALTALAIASTELVRVLGGPAPTIYNNVLTFMGPLRFDGRSYPEAVSALLRSFNVIS